MTSRSVLRSVLLAGICGAACHPAASWAQAVDYGTLEQVFGEPVTTSATGKPQRASDVPADMVIITQDDIRRSGATDIPSILQFVTGVDVRQYSFGDTQVGINGYDTPFNPRLLVLVDGRQVYLDDYGYVAWNAIPVQLDEIRQIEVVKGPNSALFGFNAASGVINVVTFDPLLDKTNVASVRGGTQAYGQGDAVATVHAGNTAGVRISVGGWTANGFEDREGTDEASPPRYASVNVSGRWQVTSNILLRAEGGDVDTHTLRAIPSGFLLDTQDQVNFWRLGAGASTGFGTLDADLYRNQALVNYANFGAINNVLVAKASDLLKVDPANTVRVGIDYRNNAITSAHFYGGQISYDNYAVNGMWNWQISPMFDLTNALRLDHLALHYDGSLVPLPGHTLKAYDNATITQPSFNSGLVVKLDDKDTMRLTAARGLQVPSLIDFGFQLNEGVLLLGSPTVLPTSIWNAELAYDRSLDVIGAALTAAVFFQRNTNLLAGGGTLPLTFEEGRPVLPTGNVGSSNEIGFEVGLKGKTDGGLRWNASYRYATISDDIASAAAATPNPFTRYDNGTPLNEIIAGLGYTIQRWELDAAGRWQSSFTDYTSSGFGFKPFVVSNYVTFTTRVGYRVTTYLTLAGTGEQFNVSRLIQSSGETVDRRFIASATVHF